MLKRQLDAQHLVLAVTAAAVASRVALARVAALAASFVDGDGDDGLHDAVGKDDRTSYLRCE